MRRRVSTWLKTVAPARIMNSMADKEQASRAAPQMSAQPIVRSTNTAMITASQAPAAAASVAVKTPAYIPPNTKTGKVKAQKDFLKAAPISFQLARGSVRMCEETREQR